MPASCARRPARLPVLTGPKCAGRFSRRAPAVGRRRDRSDPGRIAPAAGARRIHRHYRRGDAIPRAGQPLARSGGRELPVERVADARLEVHTAHGFQGDARDVMLFSLCVGRTCRNGARQFLRETGNLINVAISRARAICHVFGDLDYAAQCGVPYLETLLARRQQRREVPTSGLIRPGRNGSGGRWRRAGSRRFRNIRLPGGGWIWR